MKRWLIGSARAGATLVLALAGVASFASAASAHVTVNPNALAQGGFGRVAFRVPNESATATTVKVEVFLPAEHPIRSVSTMPVPGWSVAVERRKLDQPLSGGEGAEVTEVVAKLTWTANGPGNAIKSGQFQEFPVSLGPLPMTDHLIFKSLQTYSDGTIVRWIEEPAEGRQLERPAPVLRLTPPSGASAGAGGGGAATSSPSAVVPVGAAGDADGAGNRDDGWLPVVISITALVAGLAGLTLAALALIRTRRSST